MGRTAKIAALALASILTSFASSNVRADEGKPSEIRIAYPGVGVGNRPFVGGNSMSVVHLKGMLEEEFRQDGIKVSWSFLRGAGPATNELYANGLVDFSLLGDLPSIAGRAGGLKTRLLAATGIRGNTYLAVPADSPIQSIKDLRGKKVAIFKGTNTQLAVAKLLEANGMTEKDIRALNMDQATSQAALTTKDVDAVFGGNNLLASRDQGVSRIVYATKGDPRFLRQASFVGAEDFIKKYPSVTKRVVKVLVQAAKWISDQEKTPNAVYQLWTKSGVRYSDWREDFKEQNLKQLSSPLLDTYFVTQYESQVLQAKKYGLIRNTFDVKSWIEPRFLNEVLKELNLQSYWAPADKDGRVSALPAGAAADQRSAALAPAAPAPAPASP
ncbi:MAG: transporter substrate-binding protein [Myxococcaceae bacterium]|nr:transporter substrate-binding protein [Myxococcaceae bacterium]